MEKLPALQTNQLPATQNTIFFNVEKFEFAQRVAKLFATSSMVPDHFKENIGNCMIALNYADRIGADPFMVMQNLYIVHGKPGIEAKLAIALLNNSGKFTPLRFKYSAKKDSCIAHAKDLRSGEALDGQMISIEMARAEGWLTKKGSKWQTMPQLMLMYRSATFFIRQYAPDVLLGMRTNDELVEAVDLEVQKDGSYGAAGKTTTDDIMDRLKEAKPALPIETIKQPEPPPEPIKTKEPVKPKLEEKKPPIKEEPREVEYRFCPDKEKRIDVSAICNGTCKNRVGCPAFPEDHPPEEGIPA